MARRKPSARPRSMVCTDLLLRNITAAKEAQASRPRRDAVMLTIEQ